MLEFDESELKDDADEDEMLDEDEDKDDDDGDEGDKITSLAMEISLTDSTDVLFIKTAILLIRVWALMSKSSPSSSSSTYRNRKTKLFVNIMKKLTNLSI